MSAARRRALRSGVRAPLERLRARAGGWLVGKWADRGRVLDAPPRNATMTSAGASNRARALSRFTFESFGVRFRVAGDAPEVVARLPALLPPDARPCESAEDEF